jgi:hypothetical protein
MPPQKRVKTPYLNCQAELTPRRPRVPGKPEEMVFSSIVRLAIARLFALALAALVPISTYAADIKQTPKIAPGLPASSNPSGAAAVGKLLNPQSDDPSVPLPAPNLADRSDTDQPLQKTQIYGRGEQGGQNGSVLEGLLGVRIPFPAARGVSSGNTTYSAGDSGAESPLRTR